MLFLKGLYFITVVALCSAGRRSRQRDTKVLTYKNDNDRGRNRDAANRRDLIQTENNLLATDSCYAADGSPKKCDVSEFENVAIGKEVIASSTCGSTPQRFCRKYLDGYGQEMNHCSLCDANHRSRTHQPELAIDTQNTTCWLSDFFNDPTVENNVTYTIALKKTYELTYIILNFCNKIPESLALYKSSDNGRTWRPLQYYSSDCQGMYGVQENEVITHENEQKATCQNAYSPNSLSSPRVAFSFHIGRPSATNLHQSPILLDWITVTDIKLEFKRLDQPGKGSRRKSENYYSLSEMILGGRCKCNGHANGCTRNKDGETVCQCKHNTAGSDCERCKPFFVDRPWNPATEDNANECVACECNGHSDRCSFSRDLYLSSGRVSGGVCQNCQHNTHGPQCEYCTNGFYRNRLVPINHNDACTECDCNSHAKRCKFSRRLSLLSGGASGAVCLNCRHNTDGIHCQYCRQGYYRNNRHQITSRQACQECGCHPSGSVGQECTDSGQCLCKEGVTGSKCTECKPGYTMTRSFTNPCEKIRKTERDSLYESIRPSDGGSRTVQRSSPTAIARITSGTSRPVTKVARDKSEDRDTCDNCRSTSAIFNQEKYCKSYFVIIARVLKREKVDSEWMRFQIEVTKTYKVEPLYARVRRSVDYVYVKRSDLKCKCPKLRTKKTYIMIGVTEPDVEVSRNGYVLDRFSVVVRQRGEFETRIEEFSRAARDVSCYRIVV